MLGDLFIDRDCLLGLRDIAEGGFATVQSATLRHGNGMKQIVAVKRLKSHLASNSDFTEFIKEANLWRKLKSGDIVALTGIGAMDLSNIMTIRSSLFVVSEFMEGGTLRDVVTRAMFATSPVYKMDDAFRWFVAITRGLKYLHACSPQIIHRDLKLENILLTSHNSSVSEAKIVDLGLHMRGKTTVPDAEGSFYGGNAFDAAAHDGSVKPGFNKAGFNAKPAATAGPTLADKVRLADSRTVVGTTGNAKGPSPHNTGHRQKVVMGTIAEDPGAADGGNEDRSGSSAQNKPEPRTTGDAQEDFLNLEFLPNNYGDARLVKVIPGGAAPPATPPSCCLPSKPPAEGAANGGGAKNLSPEALRLLPTSRKGSRASTSSNNSHTPPSGPELFTGQVGSYMYMSPEMVNSHTYNEKVDVFSLTVMLYETLRGHLNVAKIAASGDAGDVMRYALKVADGFRETIPPTWPDEVRRLIARGWAQDPEDRPTASEFLKELQQLVDNDVPSDMEARRPKRVGLNPKFDCGCCSLM